MRCDPRQEKPLDREPYEDADEHDEEEALATERARRDAGPAQVLTDSTRDEVRDERLGNVDRTADRMEKEDRREVAGNDEPSENPAERLGEQPSDENAEQDGRRDGLI